jgi:hypothetical protein
MVRKEAQQAYFKDKNIETVLGDLGWCFASFFTGSFGNFCVGGTNVSWSRRSKKLIDASKQI